ncbi:deoxyribonuclease IV [Ureaplasma miroungigenitalium]|uniref:Probable endonuclease 4 n=1 Tax=Ureaplasma miroungigenitalium TaxID=1042321 RepID=A0ABT3BLQ5_9BACT|nr:deoxyribonuclease IV [Ureaplasma miroungigenitalium]MCV3728200.1 deoxyribonuclease IV [Ureaplasma miroungigenitalium]
MNTYNLIIGSHVSMKANDYFLGAVREALEYKSNTFMIYTGAPQNTRRISIDKLKVAEAHDLLKQNKIALDNIIVHAPYIINPCSSKPEVRELAKEFLIKEIQRTEALGINKIVLHPGSRLNQRLEIGLELLINMLNEIFKTIDTNVCICLETMAGKGSEIGADITELATIISQIKSKKNIGVCLDTCHMFDSGIDLTRSSFDAYLERFDQLIGLEYIKVLHINDSKNILGSHKDRHENLGYGKIGFNNLLYIIYHPTLNNIPKILETPWYGPKNSELPPYKEEIEMIRNQEWWDFKESNE